MPKPKSAKKAVPKKTRAKKADTKDETTEQSSGVSLLIGNIPPTRDMLYHWENIAGWMDKVKTAQGKLGDAKKKAKEAGVDVSTLLAVMKMEWLDPVDFAAQLR